MNEKEQYAVSERSASGFRINTAFIREYSIPLIAGVVTSLIVGNLWPAAYESFAYTPLIGSRINFNWIVNECFMVLFFASATIEIVTSMSPGGVLNPIKKAVTPLMATFGGVLGPIGVFFVLNTLIGRPEWSNGWGICTATDIALAWLAAKIVFGKRHPAVSFLLLLAVADDAIGLIIIAVFYPTPGESVKPLYLLMTAGAVALAFMMNKKGTESFWPYILLCGGISWAGLFLTGVSPALALVVIIPFLPRVNRKKDDTEGSEKNEQQDKTTLQKFENGVSPIVDYGLFLFGFANAGVTVSSVSVLTLIIMVSLILGKTIGISLFAFISAKLLKFGLPRGMKAKEIPVAGIVGGAGLTVALFVAQSAYTDLSIQGAAKMGALLSIVSAAIAFVVSKLIRIRKMDDNN